MDDAVSKAGWIWHPGWDENDKTTAGRFVYFTKTFAYRQSSRKPFHISLTADTRYKAWINHQLIAHGPVKGDENLWFYDNVDIEPFLRPGTNTVVVRVLRFFYASGHASSFARLPFPGFWLHHESIAGSDLMIRSDDTWDTALDLTTNLPINNPEDVFLHVYEEVERVRVCEFQWVKAVVLVFPDSHGLAAPWQLLERMIPHLALQPASFISMHNIDTDVSESSWERLLLSPEREASLQLSAGSRHHIELRADEHTTAMLDFRFASPSTSGGKITVTYSECYEDEPETTPWTRSKGDRLNHQKRLLGPQDIYAFGGMMCRKFDMFSMNDEGDEIFSPFHFRTFRFLTLDIEVSDSVPLIFKGIEMNRVNYPLEIRADVQLHPQIDPGQYRQLWTTSIRTLRNCMHDCFEDCPFYEQFQYAMDTRSSALFTYAVSSDDRLARQAIIQLHNTYRPNVGLTASRGPAHQRQIIPHFSLFWINMLVDHYQFSGDEGFIRQFLSTCDGILYTFSRRIDRRVGLVRALQHPSQWDFTDWADAWRPMGVPPAASRTGFSTFTNMLYVYTLRAAAGLLRATKREALAFEYEDRANDVTSSIRKHCFDGHFFTDGLVTGSDVSRDHSEVCQVWAVLSGVVKQTSAADLLRSVLAPRLSGQTAANTAQSNIGEFTPASTAMSFYTLRALSMAGDGVYDEFFHKFWDPWRQQLALNLSTWLEDDVSQRSDCHAWGCSPLYEFVTEVCGLRPSIPGWKEVMLKPRLCLFPTFSATVPFGQPDMVHIAHMSWRTNSDVVRFEMAVEFGSSSARPPIRLVTSDGTLTEIKLDNNNAVALDLDVSLGSICI